MTGTDTAPEIELHLTTREETRMVGTWGVHRGKALGSGDMKMTLGDMKRTLGGHGEDIGGHRKIRRGLQDTGNARNAWRELADGMFEKTKKQTGCKYADRSNNN